MTAWEVKKVKCTLVQALRLCTGHKAHRGSRGTALPFLDHGTRRGWGVSVTPRPLFAPRERPSTHCTGGWMVPRAGLDRCGKSRPHQDSIPGTSSPYPVAIPTTLPGPHSLTATWNKSQQNYKFLNHYIFTSEKAMWRKSRMEENYWEG